MLSTNCYIFQFSPEVVDNGVETVGERVNHTTMYRDSFKAFARISTLLVSTSVHQPCKYTTLKNLNIPFFACASVCIFSYLCMLYFVYMVPDANHSCMYTFSLVTSKILKL